MSPDYDRRTGYHRPPPPAPEPPQVIQPSQVEQYRQGYPPYDPALGPELTETSGTAIASMVLGIFSLAGMVIMGPLSLIAACVGLPMGLSARKQIRQNPALQGEGFAQAGIITSWIGIGIILALVLLVLVFMALGIALFSGAW